MHTLNQARASVDTARGCEGRRTGCAPAATVPESSLQPKQEKRATQNWMSATPMTLTPARSPNPHFLSRERGREGLAGEGVRELAGWLRRLSTTCCRLCCAPHCLPNTPLCGRCLTNTNTGWAGVYLRAGVGYATLALLPTLALLT
jgi:hypothetical protein